MKKSTITIDIELDENNVPETIQWEAPELGKKSECKAMILSVWDKTEANTMRIDLWTKEMMVDEMADFFYQNMMGMADTYLRATRLEEQANDMKEFARQFYKKFRESQIAENK
jgi:gliding motility-associated protein GldC